MKKIFNTRIKYTDENWIAEPSSYGKKIEIRSQVEYYGGQYLSITKEEIEGLIDFLKELQVELNGECEV